MLTKQEREEIAKRFKSCTKVDFSDIYRGLFGIPTPKETTIGEDDKATLNRLIELCDTSDMVELPRDKDGKVIHIGDMVWFEGVKETVSAIEMYKDTVYIHLTSPKRPNTFSSPNVLTHVDIISEHERIAQEIEEIAAGSSGTVIADDLRLVAEEIRELGNDND